MSKKQKSLIGFTLVELLVIIAIIGILGTLAISAFKSAREKARDTKRTADVRLLESALEIYYNNHNYYPTLAPSRQCADGWQDLNVLATEKIINPLPKDPLDKGGAGDPKYLYCTDSDSEAQHYLLRAFLENSANSALKLDKDDNFLGVVPGDTVNCADPYYCRNF